MTSNDPADTADANARSGRSAHPTKDGTRPPLDPLDVTPTPATLAEELESSAAELRVLDDELRVQRARIAELVALRASIEEQRRWLTALLPVPVVVTDGTGVVRSANGAAAHLLGVEAAGMPGRTLGAFVGDEDRRVVHEVLAHRPDDEPVGVRLTFRPDGADPAAVDVVVASGPHEDLTWTVVGSASAEPGHTNGTREALRLADAVVALASLPVVDATAAELVPGVAAIVGAAFSDAYAVSLVLGPPTAPVAVSTTSGAAAAADGLQVWTGEGPSVDAFTSARPVGSDDLTLDARWPHLAGGLRGAGIHAVLALPVLVDRATAGVLTCYGHTAGPIGPVHVEMLGHLAATCGAALRAVGEQVRLREESAHLSDALTSRAVIHEAKGIVIARRGGTPEEAFAHLAALSQARNRKLRDIAREIVEDASARQGGRVPRDEGPGAD